MNNNSVKLTFALTEEQAGPFPVSTESLWCDHEGENYRVKNIPFFIDELSYDDVISVAKTTDGYYTIEEVLAPSKNSTLWISLQDDNEGLAVIKNLKKLGCGSESGVLSGYFAINVPSVVGMTDVLKIVKEGEGRDFILVDYPSIRHQDVEEDFGTE